MKGGFRRARRFNGRLVLVLALALGVGFRMSGADERALDPAAWGQIQALQEEKASFTPAQRKMDSQLVFAAKLDRGEAIAKGTVSKMRVGAKGDATGMVKVDIKAAVTTNLLRRIEARGGRIVNAYPRFDAIRAWAPLREVETIAAWPEVKFVKPAVSALLHNQDAEGVAVHNDGLARTTFGVNGSGVKVGVLSGSISYLAQAQAGGDLGPVTVLPGQEGLGTPGEGTAMLEIVHAMAPGAALYYAAGEEGEAQFAQNILDLRAAGCDIIVDDIGYPDEPPFQDGLLAQAVNTVTADGALYFSAAGNAGSLDSGFSSTWQGDFVNGGTAGPPVNGKGGSVHLFGTKPYNTLGLLGGQDAVLCWADPMGASTNDYDLYVLNSTGTQVVASSINVQDGSQDPIELIWAGTESGERLVVVLASGAPRFLYVNSYGSSLGVATAGAIVGHAAATNAFAVAATDAANSYPGAFTGGSADPVEYFSSDGPRQVFFNADGSPITPGNFSSSGGFLRSKPDITATDGVTTSVPGPSGDSTGFSPFYGTSAAAPHAASIAALLKSYNPSLTPAQIRSILTGTALPMSGLGYAPMGSGMDRDSGWGIVMADRALAAAQAGLVTNSLPPGGPTATGAVSSNVPGVTLKVLYAFKYGSDGAVPNGLALGTNGILYGTTRFGGSQAENITGTSVGYGTEFEVTTNGVFAASALFDNTNGASPFAGVLRTASGAVYGTTRLGGANLYQDPSQFGYGGIFQMGAGNAILPLAVFNGTNGGAPSASLIQGLDGGLYGVAVFGGPATNISSIYGPVGPSDAGLGVGYGSVFRVATNGALAPLVFFGGTNGANPASALLQGPDGALYGTTVAGGASGHGVVFALTTNGALTVLHSFTGGLDGGAPWGSLAAGPDGNLYGTTYFGGSNRAGTVFRISTNDVFANVLSFDGTNFAYAQAALLLAADGNFYGTTAYGGPANDGGVFQLTPQGALTGLVWFDGANGSTPESTLVQGADGSLYGTTAGGGTDDDGTIFQVSLPSTTPAVPQIDLVVAVSGQTSLTNFGQAGDTVYIYGSGFSGTNALQSVTFGGVATPAGSSVVSGAEIEARIPAGAATGLVGLQFASGAVFSPTVFTVISPGPHVTGFSPARASAGTLVTIEGFGFTGVTNVLFNGLGGANQTVQSDSEISVDAPAGVTTGPLTVEGSAGVFVTSTNFVALPPGSFPPGITGQPQSVTVLQGGGAAFAVAASASAPIFYQWQFDNANLPGATNATLTLANVQAGQAGIYLVVVSNVAGTAASSNAVLVVNSPPTITTQPQSQTVLPGANVTLTVAAAGTGPFSYQWRRDGVVIPDTSINTVAGNGTSGYSGDGGAAAGASLDFPSGAAVDASGDLFIADTFNHVIRKVDANGIITTVAGVATNGFSGDGGPATGASLNYPYGVAVDASGDLFIADFFNNRIRKVDANGIITTVAGNGAPGYSGDGGAAVEAGLQNPISVAVDASGELLIADYSNDRVRKVDANGTITTVAGNGTAGFSGDGGAATNARLNTPGGVAVEASGILFIADQGNSRVRKVGLNGVITTMAGNGTAGYSGDGGAATNAGLNSPAGVAADASGDLFIADTYNQVVRKVDPNGMITTAAGSSTNGFSGDGGAPIGASLSYPAGVAVDASGNLFIADTDNNRIREVSLGGSPFLTLDDITSSTAGQFQAVVTGPYGSATSLVAFVMIGSGSNQTTSIVMSVPQLSGNNLLLGFTLSQGTGSFFTLLQTASLTGPWTTNTAAILTTNAPAGGYQFSIPMPNAVEFYQVRSP